MTKPTACPEPGDSPSRRGRPRGGARPGAGAPRGNLNAYKHGRRSRQMAEIGALIAFNPSVANAISLHNQRQGRTTQTATELAAEVVNGLYKHAKDIARGIDSPGPFRRLLTEKLPAGLNATAKHPNVHQSSGTPARRRTKTPTPNPRTTHKSATHPTINQPPATTPAHNQTADTKTPPKPVD